MRTLITFTILFANLIFQIPTEAEESRGILVKTSKGSYVLIISATGVATAARVERTVDLTMPPDPDDPTDPTDPTDPKPPPAPETFQGRVTVLVGEIDAEPIVKKLVAETYKILSQEVKSGGLPVGNALKAARDALDAVFRITNGKPESWQKFREALTTEASARQQRGVLGTQAQMGGFFEEIRLGIEGHLDASGLFGNIDFAKLIELIKFILELIKAFSATEGVSQIEIPCPLSSRIARADRRERSVSRATIPELIDMLR